MQHFTPAIGLKALYKYYPYSRVACPKNDPSSLQQVYTAHHDKLAHRYPFNPRWGDVIEVLRILPKDTTNEPRRTQTGNPLRVASPMP